MLKKTDKKLDKKKSEKSLDKSEKKKYERQLKWIFIIMGIIIVTTVVVYFLIESTKKFEYGGLKFQKIMYDKLPLYYSRIQIINAQGQLLANYNLYLRNDPRKLKDIGISGQINIAEDYVKISLDRASESECDGREILRNLAELIKGTGKEIEIGFNDINLSVEKNMSYITCENSETATIMFHSSSITRITQKGNCYDVEFENCEIGEVTERFIVGWIAHAGGVQI